MQFKFEALRVPVSLSIWSRSFIYTIAPFPQLRWGEGEGTRNRLLKHEIISHALTVLTNSSHLQVFCSVLVRVLICADRERDSG